MKDYFIRLFNYDRYASEIILKTIIIADNPQKEVQLMAHLLAAQQVWLNRCLNIISVPVTLWPGLGNGINDFDIIMSNNYTGWINFLDGCTEKKFDAVIHYKNTKGETYENHLMDILAHVINHGTHHRAQIGQLLKSSGTDNLPITDYIFYLR